MFKWLIYILLIFTIFVLSCENENNNNYSVFTGKEYFPLITGNSLIYKVTEITIDKPSEVYDTSIYYLKEITDIALLDNENDTAYRIERYTKKTLNDNWIIHSVWSAKITENTAEKVEENYRYVKIRFPVKTGYSWNGNIFNECESQEYRTSSVNSFYQIGDFAFDSCLTVVHDSSFSLIHKDLAYEVYAYRIGLIYKEQTYINSQEVVFEVPIEERITTGTIYIQELVEIDFINE
ncbi:MAG TPA: hypothetical protein PKN32_02740 [Bacteroidales bacterium]|nr:hypothetical protein [Bacteroidales bacterium]